MQLITFLQSIIIINIEIIFIKISQTPHPRQFSFQECKFLQLRKLPLYYLDTQLFIADLNATNNHLGRLVAHSSSFSSSGFSYTVAMSLLYVSISQQLLLFNYRNLIFS